MSLVRILNDLATVGDSSLRERFGKSRNKISLERRCTVRAEEIVLSLGIVSIYLSASGIDMNIPRPVPSRDFDEYPGLKASTVGNFAALLKIKSKVSNVRVCRESNLEELSALL
jgi:hypothetical protein